jgi:hypothetical protein
MLRVSAVLDNVCWAFSIISQQGVVIISKRYKGVWVACGVVLRMWVMSLSL